MSDDFDSFPRESQFNVPITSSIPYFFRWRILQCKLMLADIDTLIGKYDVPRAKLLKELVLLEVNDLCDRLYEAAAGRRERREQYTEKAVHGNE